MAGLDPAIHGSASRWMAASRAAMTGVEVALPRALRCQFRIAHMARPAMFLEIALVIVLGLPEGGGGLDLGHHRLLPLARCLDLGLFLRRDAGLLRVLGED